jgi:hypothetical protein
MHRSESPTSRARLTAKLGTFTPARVDATSRPLNRGPSATSARLLAPPHFGFMDFA